MCVCLVQTADPDSRSAVRDSLRMGSNMEEAAFTHILQRHIQLSPGLPLVHVPPQLLCSWAMMEGSSADVAMQSWCEEHRQVLLDATYIAFHWTEGHYCSLVLNLDVWRCGPSPNLPAVPSAHEPTVPFLHLDTLPAGCRVFDVIDPSLLLRICRVFNFLCGTTWPTDAASWAAHLPVCGPPPQQDDWSCGYRLLRAWELIMKAGEPFTAPRCNHACTPMAALPLMQLVQDTSAQYTNESEVRLHVSRQPHADPMGLERAHASRFRAMLFLYS